MRPTLICACAFCLTIVSANTDVDLKVTVVSPEDSESIYRNLISYRALCGVRSPSSLSYLPSLSLGSVEKYSQSAEFYCLEIKLVLLVLTALVTGAFYKDYVT